MNTSTDYRPSAAWWQEMSDEELAAYDAHLAANGHDLPEDDFYVDLDPEPPF